MGNYIRYTYAALAVMLIALIAYAVPFFLVYRIIDPLIDGQKLSAGYLAIHIAVIFVCELAYATLIPVFLLANEGRYVSALRFLMCYGAALFLLKYYISAESTGVLSALLVGYCGIVAQFMPAMIMAWYVIHTTKIGEFMSAMQKMHVPDGISVSLAVVMRFFPTIKEEYLSINDAMKMRGISFAGGRITKMIEYRLVPLMFSCLNIGEELSAAAVTRGLGSPVRRMSPI